jgi:hypothetical protein
MKMLLVVYGDAVDEDVMNSFKRCHVKGYTEWRAVFGEGSETEPKLGTHYWPGHNNVVMAVLEDDKVPEVAEAIKVLKREHPKAGIRTFVLHVEETI